YIDSTNLEVQIARYSEFFAHPAVKELVAAAPLYATWDDHDFGTNDRDGTIEGKGNSRAAFVRFHPKQTHGENDQGIYTSFRQGPIEVFLLDTRWFSRCEASKFAPSQMTLLGEQQWAWLERSLVASTAPFKLLACGMIWNDAVRPAKTDFWGAYPAEREHLFRFIGEKRVGGVVLVGGDIHRSRVVRHETRELAGYEISELITSPLAQAVIAAADAPHPGLVWDIGAEQTYLVVEADTKGDDSALRATFRDERGRELFAYRLAARHLKPSQNMHAASARGFLFDTLRVGERDYQYATYVPRASNSATKRSALVFLHGMGESGVEGSLQLAVGLAPAIVRAPEAWPFVVVFPQKPTREDEWGQHEAAVLAMLDHAIARHDVDPARVALTGLSQGGHGTWEIARRHPQRFAALAPICGYPAAPARGWKEFERERDWTIEAATNAAHEIANVLAKKPVFAFHGDADTLVPVEFSDVVVKSLLSRGASVRYERLPGIGHDAWTHAYQQSELARWLAERLAPIAGR
ncbi:MAG: alkaline phosphatase D family protein, partial [Burkholderiales bacterium]